MSDLLLDLGKNPHVRRLLKSARLPLPLPEVLLRDEPEGGAPTLGRARISVGAGPMPELGEVLRASLAGAGAAANPASAAAEAEEHERLDALVFDASGLAEPASLRAVFDFFRPLAPRLAPSGRALIVARPPGGAPERAAAQQALEGFVRSLAKEIGRRGATANLVRVEPGAEARLGPVLAFLLSRRSAFVTGQPLFVSSLARDDRGDRGGDGAPAPSARPLEGKVALVTGAARGIGEATARRLSADGARVLVVDREAEAEALGRLAAEIGGDPLALDVASPEAPSRAAEAALAKGGLDVLVHNAGITRDRTLARMRPELWDEVMDVNLGAALRLSRALDPAMRKGGRVICLSSIAALAGNAGQTAYAASKAGLVGYVRALAEELAPRGIAVCAVAPGFIETRMTAAMPFAIREAARRLSALGQGGLPEDVAHAIAFLATPGARGLSGSVLRVCGGAFVGG